MPAAQFALIALAGFAAGAVNALAGGGTLISFPALVAAGFPPLAARSDLLLARHRAIAVDHQYPRLAHQPLRPRSPLTAERNSLA